MTRSTSYLPAFLGGATRKQTGAPPYATDALIAKGLLRKLSETHATDAQGNRSRGNRANVYRPTRKGAAVARQIKRATA